MESMSPEGFEQPPSLRERMPDYLATFGIGFVVSSAIGLIFWLITDTPLASSVGYTVILYGVVLLLAGGASGGGYTHLGMGAMGALFGTRRVDEPQPEANSSFKVSPNERLQRGLRPESNPRAFWQVVSGALYIAIGLLMLTASGS
jgi:hypothetical protein